VLLSVPLLLTLLYAPVANAGPGQTQGALDRAGELLELRLEDGRLSRDEVLPALIVSAEPRYVDSEAWFEGAAVGVLSEAFGSGGLRLCQACMVPRTVVERGQLVYQTGPISLDEVRRLDEQARGAATPARSAIWLDEAPGGVSLRVIDLNTARVLYAQNVDEALVEHANTRRVYTLSEELERRARGDSLTQAFVDIAVYPNQHISLDWTDQWGATNANLSGVSISFVDPMIGLGAVHYRRLPYYNILVGGKGLVSMPTALARTLSDTNIDILDPIFTAVGVVRVPFGRSNYGAVITASSNGKLAIGVSLMNISLLPVLL